MSRQKNGNDHGKGRLGLKLRWQRDRSFRLLAIGLLLFSSLTLLFLLQTVQN